MEKPLQESNQTMTDDGGVDLLELLAAFLRQKRTFLIWTVMTLLISVAYIFTLRSRYVATATLLPHDMKSGGVEGLFSSHSPAAVFGGLLGSRGVLDSVMDETGFMKAHGISSREVARATVLGMSKFEVGADSIVTISVKDNDAREAARLANAYLDSLDHLNGVMAQEDSERQQRFYAEQIQEERTALADAETRLEQTQVKTGLVAPETQTQLGLSAIAGVRGQITAIEVQLSSLLQSETEQNPDVERLESQLRQLRSKEASMEGGSGSPMGAAPGAGQLPGTNLDVARAQRDVLFHNTVMTQLLNRYESVRQGVESNEPQYEVVDRAVVPETKAWPPRKSFLLAAAVLAVIVGVVAVLVRLIYLRLMGDPVSRRGLERVRGALLSR